MPGPSIQVSGGGGGSSLSNNIGKGCMVCLSADLTLTADNAVHNIVWDTEYYDDAAFHAGTNTDRMVIPAGYGGAGTRFRLQATLNMSAAGWLFYLVDESANRICSAGISVANTAVDIDFTVDAPADAAWFAIGAIKAATNADLNSAFDLFATRKLASYFQITKIK